MEPCIDESLIDPNAVCITLYSPVCGCDGVTYDNSCLAQVVAGVTSWSEALLGEPCQDLAGVDFGECDMVLGVAQINGVCTLAVSGCDWVVNGAWTTALLFEDSPPAPCATRCARVRLQLLVATEDMW